MIKVSPEGRTRIEADISHQTIRDILVAMCRKNNLSLANPWEHDKEAPNFILAQRLGIGSVFGLPDNEGNEDEGTIPI